MPNIKLDTVRSGVKLLSGLMKRADEYNTDDGKVSRRDLTTLLGDWGDKGSMDTAMKAVLRYTQNRYDTGSPTYSEINKALGTAMKAIAKADKNKSKDLSATEMKTLAKTWDAIVDFSKEYKGSSVEELTGNSGEYES